jgi:CBS domain-containing protein
MDEVSAEQSPAEPARSATRGLEARSDGSVRLLGVRDVMGPAVVVREDAPLREVAALMLERHAQGALVVDARAVVVGVVTERSLTLGGDFLRRACLDVPRIGDQWVTPLEQVDAACIAAESVTAREVMETRITRASVDEPVGAVVERMLRRDAECAVACQDGAVVGTLDGHDLLRRVAGAAALAPSDRPTTVGGASLRLPVGPTPRPGSGPVRLAVDALSLFAFGALLLASVRAVTGGAAVPPWTVLAGLVVATGLAATLEASRRLARGVSIRSAELLPMLVASAIGAVVFVLLAVALEVRTAWFLGPGALAQPVALALAAWLGERRTALGAGERTPS